MIHPDLINRIAHELATALPGETAQFKMAGVGRQKSPASSLQPKNSAVMIMLYPKNNELYFPVIQRPVYEGVHSGQMALPGGALDKSLDKDLKETAFRELHEEIGIDLHLFPHAVLGKLSQLFIPPSNFLVEPYVAYTSICPNFQLNTYEVHSLLEVPVMTLLKEEIVGQTTVVLQGGQKIQVPCYCIDNSIIWGATAMMLSEFKEVLQKLLLK